MWLSKCYIYLPARYLKTNIKSVIEKHKVIKEWAYIYHVAESEYDYLLDHYHIYLDFYDKKINTEWIAKWFNIPEFLIKVCDFSRETIIDIFLHYGPYKKYKRRYNFKDLYHKF